MDTDGNEGCPCIDATSTLASLSDRRCERPDGEIGIQLTLGGSCAAFSYGSSRCRQHDLVHDEKCSLDELGESNIDAYCVRPWCFVDMATCISQSIERVYSSSYFPEAEGDLFYSYSKCNSTADDWFEAEADIMGKEVMGGITIKANIPTYVFPMMYKKDPSTGEALSMVNEYYNNSVPYEGVYVDYLNMIEEISKGDIVNITHSYKSKVSSVVHPGSSFTAAIQDIEDGLVDMSIGPFWITAERLQMASFSLPIVYDKTFLVIPRPIASDDLYQQTKKVLMPFSRGLWFLVLGVIVVAAVLSVWFSDKSEKDLNKNENLNHRMLMIRNKPKKRRSKRAYARLLFDSFIQKGLFFFGAGVEQDENASLPNKLLLFGFGAFILISVSAYVANLAAFLTLSTVDSVSTMDSAVAAGLTICAHPALKDNLRNSWPDAKFYFHENAMEFPGLLLDFDEGNCDVMAIGYEDTIMDSVFLEGLCSRDLVYTDSLIVEIPIAFPIKASLAAGLSYWMYQGERSGITIQASKDKFPQEVSCSINFSAVEGSDYDYISIKNMFLPAMFFVACVVLAVILQIVHAYRVRRGEQSLVGTQSTLSLVTDSNRKERNRRKKRITRLANRKYDESSSEEENDFNDNKLGDRRGSAISWADEQGCENDDSGRLDGLDESDISPRSLMAGSLHMGSENDNNDYEGNINGNGDNVSLNLADGDVKTRPQSVRFDVNN